MFLASSLIYAVDEPDVFDEPLSAVELTRLILDSEPHELASPEAVATDTAFSHYDPLGFPETSDGRLFVQLGSFGPATTLRGERTSFLLYAQYTNEQRDAVLLARAGQISDPLPDGGVYTVPFGFGAVRMNAVDISIVEGIVLPHISDNRKAYTEFPLFDLYAGLTAGTDGIGIETRGVFRERYTAHLSTSSSSARYIDDGTPRRTTVVSFTAGGGLRVPGFLPELIGPNLLSFGGDALLEVRGNALGGGVGFQPGAFLELERVFFDEPPDNRDFRTDPRPFNYRVHSVFARLTGRIDPQGIVAADPLRLGLAIGYRVNVIGPRIPEHEFKRTEIVYVADDFLDDIRRQVERRDARPDSQ